MSDTDIQWIKSSLERIETRMNGLERDHKDLMKEVSLIRSEVAFVKGGQVMLILLVLAPMIKYRFFA